MRSSSTRIQLGNMSRVFVSVFVVFLAFAHTCVGGRGPRCEANSEPKPCGHLCERTCEKPGKKHCLPDDREKCPTECQCVEGYVRHNGKCIKVENCPSRCPANEIFTMCGRLCEPTCTNEKPRCPKIACTKRTEGCRCKKGYLRDTTTNKCVLRKDCVKCGINEEVGACGRICEGTCKDRDPGKCAAISCTGFGCMCKAGFYRNEKTDICGPVKQCPKPKKCTSEKRENRKMRPIKRKSSLSRDNDDDDDDDDDSEAKK